MMYLVFTNIHPVLKMLIYFIKKNFILLYKKNKQLFLGKTIFAYFNKNVNMVKNLFK